jgi:hypothetical protein
MNIEPTAESATAPEVGDITKEEAFALLRSADKKGVYSHSISTSEMRHPCHAHAFNGANFSVILTPLDGGTQFCAQHVPSMRQAVDSVIAQLAQPASEKAAKLRAEAAAILTRAAILEREAE